MRNPQKPMVERTGILNGLPANVAIWNLEEKDRKKKF